MTFRTFRHSVKASQMTVADGSDLARLMEADDNWTEVSPKEAKDGTRDSGGRGGVARSKSDGEGKQPRRRSARKG